MLDLRVQHVQDSCVWHIILERGFVDLKLKLEYRSRDQKPLVLNQTIENSCLIQLSTKQQRPVLRTVLHTSNCILNDVTHSITYQFLLQSLIKLLELKHKLDWCNFIQCTNLVRKFDVPSIILVSSPRFIVVVLLVLFQ